MASFRKPGPLGFDGNDDSKDRKPGPLGLEGIHHDVIGDRFVASPLPGVIGHHARPPRDQKFRTRKPAAKGHKITTLSIGSSGDDVRKLQRLLNSRLYGGAFLKVDGRFGSRTLAAVLEFQKRSALLSDGIVGRKTWFRLFGAPIPRVPVQPVDGGKLPGMTTSTAGTATIGSSVPTTGGEKSVLEWMLEEKFTYVLHATGKYLRPDLKQQFEALLTPTNLGIFAGPLVVW